MTLSFLTKKSILFLLMLTLLLSLSCGVVFYFLFFLTESSSLSFSSWLGGAAEYLSIVLFIIFVLYVSSFYRDKLSSLNDYLHVAHEIGKELYRSYLGNGFPWRNYNCKGFL